MSDEPKTDKATSEPSEMVQAVRTLGLIGLTFIAGSFVTYFDSFPYDPLLKPGFEALTAISEQVDVAPDTADLNFWGRPRTPQTGVTIYNEAKASPGYTLYTSGHLHGAFLIDMNGDVVHKWELPFSEVWPEPKHADYKDDRRVYWRRVEMLPNGELLAQFYGYHATPYGFGLIKVDRDSNLLWKSEVNVHHDFQVADDGTIWTIDHAFRDLKDRPIDGVTHLPDTILEDRIVQLSADGELLQTISVYEALAQSPFRHLATLTNPAYASEVTWDPLHTNGIAILDEAFASHYPFASPGMVMISMRRPDGLAIVDLETKQAVWANRGFWTRQHDPDPLPNGHVMIYDNRGNAGVGGTSRIIEFDPVTNAIEWMYAGTAEQPFESEIRSNQQVLPNGNVLTCEHTTGRIFEVTRSGEVVWEFHNPHRIEENGEVLVPGVGSVHRYPDFPLKAEPTSPAEAAAARGAVDAGSVDQTGTDAGVAD